MLLRKKALGDEHPNTLYSMLWVGIELDSLKRHQESYEIHKKTM